MKTSMQVIPDTVIDFIETDLFPIELKNELLDAVFIPDSELIFRLSDMLSYPLVLHYISPALNKYESRFCSNSSVLKKMISLTPCPTVDSPLLITMVE